MSDLNQYLEDMKRKERDAAQEQLNKMLYDVGLDSKGAAIPEWKPKVAPPTPGELGEPSTTKDIWLYMNEASAGFYNTGANVFMVMDKAATKVSQWTGLQKGGALAMLESYLRTAAESIKPKQEDFANKDKFSDYLLRGLVHAPVAIGQYVAGGHVVGNGIAGMALIDALREADKGWWEASKAGIMGAVMGTGLKLIEPFSRPARAALGAAGFGGVAAAQGAGGAEIAAQSLIGGGMAALPATKKPIQTPSGGPLAEAPKALPAPEAPKALPAPEAPKALPAPEGMVQEGKPIRQGPPAEQKALPSPEQVAAQKAAAELKAAQESVNAELQTRGIDNVLMDVIKNTNDPRVRTLIEQQRRRYQDETKFGPIDAQLAKDPAVKQALGIAEIDTPAKRSAAVFAKEDIEATKLRQSEEGGRKLKEDLRQQEGRGLQENAPEGAVSRDFQTPTGPTPEYVTQKIHEAASDMRVNPQEVIHSVKALEALKVDIPEVAKQINNKIQQQVEIRQTGRGTKTFISAPEAPPQGVFKEGMDFGTPNVIMAYKLKSGEIKYDKEARIHAQGKGINFDDVTETGFIIDNKYTASRDDATIRKLSQDDVRSQQVDAELGAQARLAEKQRLSDKGFSTFDVNFALARTITGAAYGFTQGDTIEERLTNAFIGAGIGGLASPKMIKTLYQKLRGIDPDGIKRVEQRDRGLTPGVENSWDSTIKTDPKKMAEFLNMGDDAAKIEGRVQGINYDYINTPNDVKYVIGRMAKVYQDELDKIRKLGRTHETLQKEAEQLAGTKKGEPERLLTWPDGKPMTDAELLLTRTLRNDLGAGLQESSIRFQADPSPQNLTSFIDSFNRYRMVQQVYAGQASARGQGLEALKINVGQSGELEFHRMLGDVVESVDPTGWTPQRLAGAISQIPDIGSLSRAVDIAARPGMHDMLLEAFYGVSMLSNPKTWVVNMIGSPLAYNWQIAKRSIAGASSFILGKTGDPQYVQPVEPLMMLQAIKDSYHDAFTVAKKAFDTGERIYPYTYGGKHALARPPAITYDNLKAVYPKTFNAAESAMSSMGMDAQVLKAGIDLLGHTARLSTRLMLAPDEFNEFIGARMELYARSARSSAAEGLSYSQQAARARERIHNMEGLSTADKEAAKTFALYNTFNQEPGTVTNRLIGVIENLNKSPDIDPVWYLATKAVVPFITIPSNIARWATRESGPTAFLSRQLKEQMAKGGAEAQVAWAGVALGSMVMGLAANLAMNGVLNGHAPVQRADRLVWEADGNVEYGIKTPIGNFSLNRLDPIAIPFAWAADFVNLAGHIDAYDATTLTATAILTMTHDLASKNYIQGLTQFLHAITSMDSKELQRFVKGQTGSLLVPGIVRGIRQETDPYRRATNTALDAARQSTPWGSTDYPIVLDRFARPIYSGYGAGQGWASIFGIINPIQYRAPNEKRVIQEITQNKIPIPEISDTIFGARDNPYDNKPLNAKHGIKLEGWEFYLFNKYSGEKLFEELSKRIDTPLWKQASPGPAGGKALIFNSLVAASDEYARMRILKEFPDLEAAVRLRMSERKESLRSTPGVINIPSRN